MLTRFFIVIGILAAIIYGLYHFKSSKMKEQMAQGGFVPPPTAVTTVMTREETWAPVLTAVGTLEPVNGVKMSTDLSGIVIRIGFESGRPVRAGDLLVQLDTAQEQATLRSAEARAELARLNRARLQGLLAKSATSKSEFDSADAECRQATAAVDEQKALIARKTIRAPFDGLAGIRKVNVGQYVNPGDPLVELTSLDPIYLNFSLPQQYVPVLVPGRIIRARVEGVTTQVFEGKITALDSVVDPSTRNINVQATLGNAQGQLRPGMFARVEVILPDQEKVIAIPGSSISYAPYGDSVFVLEDGAGPDGKPQRVVRQQVVNLGATRGDQVAVVSGLKAGEEIVSSGTFKLRAGAAVAVNNTVQPGNNPAPVPADN